MRLPKESRVPAHGARSAVYGAAGRKQSDQYSDQRKPQEACRALTTIISPSVWRPSVLCGIPFGGVDRE